MGNCFTSNCFTSTSANQVTQIDPANEIGEGQEVQQPTPTVSRAMSYHNINFTYEELEKATKGFCRDNYLGEGGFGAVYKGVLEDGRVVAVKKLKKEISRGDREFQSEAEIITRVHHRHLVTLVGCCVTEERRLLVYEFVINNSLSYQLHGKERPTIEWPTRFKIALGSAKGWAYLHKDCKPRIIHRDIKSDNILLDDDWEAKISDFGLAVIFPDDKTHIDASRMAGTIGIYSKEQKPNKVKRYLEKEKYDKFVDPHLKKEYDDTEMKRMVKCAAACVRRNPRSRPSMNKVLLVLQGHSPVDSLDEEAEATRMPRSRTLGPSEMSNGIRETGTSDKNTVDSTHDPTLIPKRSPEKRKT